MSFSRSRRNSTSLDSRDSFHDASADIHIDIDSLEGQALLNAPPPTRPARGTHVRSRSDVPALASYLSGQASFLDFEPHAIDTIQEGPAHPATTFPHPTLPHSKRGSLDVSPAGSVLHRSRDASRISIGGMPASRAGSLTGLAPTAAQARRRSGHPPPLIIGDGPSGHSPPKAAGGRTSAQATPTGLSLAPNAVLGKGQQQSSPRGGPVKSPKGGPKPGLFRSGTIAQRGAPDTSEPGRRDSEIGSEASEEGHEEDRPRVAWRRVVRWFLWLSSVVLVIVGGYFTAVARRGRDSFARNTSRFVDNPDLSARICFMFAYIWLSYIVLDFIMEPLINLIKNQWTVGKTAASVKYYLDEMKSPLKQSIYWGALMAAFAGIFYPYKKDKDFEEPYDWILRIMACILVFLILRTVRVAVVKKIFATFSKQAYFEQIQELLLMNFVLSRLLEQAEIEHQIRADRKEHERRAKQVRVEKNLQRFAEAAKKSSVISALKASHAKHPSQVPAQQPQGGTPDRGKGSGKNLMALWRGGDPNAPSAPPSGTAGAGVLSPQSGRPSGGAPADPTGNLNKTLSQSGPRSAYVREDSTGAGPSRLMGASGRGPSVLGRGGGAIQGTEIGMAVRDVVQVGSRMIRGVGHVVQALTMRDRDNATYLHDDPSFRVQDRRASAGGASQMSIDDRDASEPPLVGQQVSSNMEQALENRNRLDKLEKYALIDKDEADEQKLMKLEKRVREGLVTRFVWNGGRGRADITRDERKRDADAASLGKFLYRNLAPAEEFEHLHRRSKAPPSAVAGTDPTTRGIPRDEFLARLRGILVPVHHTSIARKERSARDKAEEAVMKLFAFFDVNRDGSISNNDLVVAVQTIFRNFFKAQQRLEESNSLMATMHRVVGFIGFLIGLILDLWILKLDLSKLWLSVTSIVLSLSFVFGQSLRKLYEAVVYVFFIHPFDVDDAVIVNGMFFRVKKIQLLTTEMQSGEGERAYFPNHVLASSVILNISRSEPKMEELHVYVPLNFPRDIVKKLERHVDVFLKGRADLFSGIEASVRLGLSRSMSKVRLTVAYTLTFPDTDPVKGDIARSQLLLSVRDFLVENGIEVLHSDRQEEDKIAPRPRHFGIAIETQDS